MAKEESKKKIINRLRTIKGHISGIEKMVEDDRACEDILVQITAIKSSIHKVGLKIIEENACDCMSSSDGTVDKDKIDEIFKTLLKYSK